MTDDDRTSYVGGPGAATILGVNPYQTPLDLWMHLTKRAEPLPDNPDFSRGRLLERAVLDYCAEELGRKVLPGPFVRDVALPIAAGHLDGLTEGVPEIVEGKTVRNRKGYGEPGSGEVPAVVAAQCEWYMGLMPEVRVAWVPVLFSGFEFAMYRVERDDRVIEQMRNLVWRWWQDYVLTDSPPPPVNANNALTLFPRDTGRVVVADDATVEAVLQLRELKVLASDLETRIEDRESRIKVCMGDAASLSLPDGEIAATWKTTKPSMRFDQSAFKEAQPEVYKTFCREQTSRRFLLRKE